MFNTIAGMMQLPLTDEGLQRIDDVGRRVNRAMSGFDLAKAMANGGKCLAGDRPARIVCTDMKGLRDGLVVLVDEGNGTESAETFTNEGLFLEDDPDESADLRNLPEEHEVTLWFRVISANNAREYRICFSNDRVCELSDGWKPYGPPVKVKFPEGS